MKHVPALSFEDEQGNNQVLIESMAICEFLEETHPKVPLLGKDPVRKAKIRACCEIINSGIQPL